MITYDGSKEQNHITILGDKAILYYDYGSVYKILYEFKKNMINMEGNGYLYYNPENIMRIFDKVYISG